MIRRQGGGIMVGGMRTDSLPASLRPLVHTLYEIDGKSMPDISAAVDVAAGWPVAVVKIRNYVKYNKLQRPDGWSAWAAANGGLMWTTERDDVLLRNYQTSIPRVEILDEINRLPGGPIRRSQMKDRVKTLSLRRNRMVSVRLLRATDAEWSVDRTKRLLDGFNAGKSAADILIALNGLPGQPVSPAALRSKAGAMRLYWSRRPGQCKPAMVARPLVAAIVKPDVQIAAASKCLAAWIEPPVGPDGVVAVPFLDVRHWCLTQGFDTDGTDMDRVNRARRFYGKPPMVVDWTVRVAA